MGNIDGSKKNQDGGSRSEEKGRYRNIDSGGSRDVGHQGAEVGYQSQRADRTDGEEPGFVGARETVAGGMVSQLIDEFRDQVAARKNDIERFESEVQHLESKIKQLETFLGELAKLDN